jgi:hypothetical protein
MYLSLLSRTGGAHLPRHFLTTWSSAITSTISNITCQRVALESYTVSSSESDKGSATIITLTLPSQLAWALAAMVIGTSTVPAHI